LALAVLALVLLAGAASVALYWYPFIAPQIEAWFAPGPSTPPPQPNPPTLTPPGRPSGPSLTPSPPPTPIPVPNSPPPSPTPLPPGPTPVTIPPSPSDCFLAVPPTTADGRALEVYAASTADIDQFQADFKRANGVDAAISRQLITAAQCPALAFLSRLRGAAGVPPRLDVGAPVVRSGSAMTGTVSGISDRAIELVLVADDGLVYNITTRLAGAGDSRPFSVIIKLVESGTAKPQLVLAIAAARPLASLRPSAGGSLGAADQLFPRVLNEARQAGQTLNASAKLFRLEN
jgi:serine/threonine-protein kinase